MWNSFTTALAFLTILRLPSNQPDVLSPRDLAKSFSFYPVVGLLLGVCWLTAAYFLRHAAPPLLLAAILTTLMTLLTRALHLDGLADMADGIGGGYTPERRLEIMKDSRTGAFGAIALVLALIIKVAALQAIIQNANWTPLLVIPALSRFSMVLMAYRSPYARKEGGLGRAFLENMTIREVLAAAITASTLMLLLPLKLMPYYAVAFLLGAFLLRQIATKSLGGITGDVLGATNEVSEIVLLSIAACCPAASSWHAGFFSS